MFRLIAIGRFGAWRSAVLRRESVPAHDKIVSIFEPRTDIIVKDGRQTQHGHKVLSTLARPYAYGQARR